MLIEVFKGFIFFKKRYYRGWFQNCHNLFVAEFLIEADWFDSLPKDQQQEIYKKEHDLAVFRSMKTVELD